MTTDLAALEAYLHTHIPLSRAMEVAVVQADARGVRLRAPLGPNINHRDTVFGGSASALAILAGWTLIHTRLRDDAHPSRIVIQRNSIEYTRPLPGDFEAFCPAPAPESWERFLRSLHRRGRARIQVYAELYGEGKVAGSFQGSYVAFGERAARAGIPDRGTV